MVVATIELGISILRGGNIDVQKVSGIFLNQIWGHETRKQNQQKNGKQFLI